MDRLDRAFPTMERLCDVSLAEIKPIAQHQQRLSAIRKRADRAEQLVVLYLCLGGRGAMSTEYAGFPGFTAMPVPTHVHGHRAQVGLRLSKFPEAPIQSYE